ncbi:T6SS effector amidase Tae4 family protein [Nonlabens ulvanivorans]|uniref:T6SS effector amidase Tae4 family protein n=1 Tax=Nonlabens ulvanivorans TaxID=906888 RepID=UPI002941D94B|nr:T6SS effector amidase Tae4 family protein [Nonlabens ulvanivorans]WOI21617.1 T6SS effector amidase Tae4 family protein [Nonlabens ulvanivorans]
MSAPVVEGEVNVYSHNAEWIDAYWYHPDHLGSSSYITNMNGVVTQHMEYLPFGETLVEEHQNSYNVPYKFNGKELDGETGNYYYGARYYNPKFSQWLSVDPLAEKMPSWSPYNYTFNNPIRYTDPTGMAPEIVDPPDKITNYFYEAIKNNYNKDGQSILEKKGSALSYLANKDTNTCAIRMSDALNGAGYSIPSSKDTPADVRIQTGNDNDSGNFILDAVSMGNYLEDIEAPTLSLTNLNSDEKIEDAMKQINSLGDDFKGIIVLSAGDRSEYGATGHVDLLYEDFWGDMSLYSSGVMGGGADVDDYLQYNKSSNLSIRIWAVKTDDDD